MEDNIDQVTWKKAFMTTPGPRNWREAGFLFTKGICMGAADVVPGVSGGTIAFITGIYDNFVKGIASFDAIFVKRLCRFRWREALAEVYLRFLLCVGIGVSLAIFSLSGVIQGLMENHPVPTWAMFFGLIAGSILVVFKEVNKWTFWRALLFAAGIAVAWNICGLIPVSTPNGLWFYFLSGVIGICAMILPGISGSFLLLVLGKYYNIMSALHQVKLALKSVLVDFDFAGAYAILAGPAGDTGPFWLLVFFQLGQITGMIGFSLCWK